MLRIFLQITLTAILMGGTLYCSSNSGSGKNTGANPDPNSGTNPVTNPTTEATLKDACYSCSQYATTGDTCGQSMISGTTSQFSFTEDTQIILSINDQVELTGTYQDNALDLSKDHVDYIGPGCNLYFTNLKLTATITPAQITSGWYGTFSYDVNPSASDSECDDADVSACHAVHSVTCDPGC